MRSIVASVLVFLVVTIVLLHRTSAHDAATPPSSAIAPATATASASPPQASMMIGQPATPPSALQPTASVAPVATRPAPTATPQANPEASPADDNESSATTSHETETEESASTSRTQLAADASEVDSLRSGGWADAIQTLDGGVMAMVMSGSANVRSAPTVNAPVVAELHTGWPIALYGVEVGGSAAGTDLWYRTWSGNYISAATVGPFVAPHASETFAGHWVEVNLTTNYVIAWVDDTPVYAATSITGKPGFETPTGTFSIFRRNEIDTLDSATTGIAEGDAESYRLENVPWVQYFADGGFALHANYWSDPWEYGYARSHGCVNLMVDDAAWFWQFLSIGSTVSIHE
ncbi:MAG TPA: L,D-transpeptidase family protein [Thermomicrobiales bacterium]|nr:L,D-transpeptidase family protein [Thermomicrobiales bacterium]HQZ88582.1 L,D-transpeptidase family protein [Thermomicrobiales bacterium]HRA30305.1 L,D-transpeptidase family protein [Thermomicrobiales bacterium]